MIDVENGRKDAEDRPPNSFGYKTDEDKDGKFRAAVLVKKEAAGSNDFRYSMPSMNLSNDDRAIDPKSKGATDKVWLQGFCFCSYPEQTGDQNRPPHAINGIKKYQRMPYADGGIGQE